MRQIGPEGNSSHHALSFIFVHVTKTEADPNGRAV